MTSMVKINGDGSEASVAAARRLLQLAVEKEEPAGSDAAPAPAPIYLPPKKVFTTPEDTGEPAPKPEEIKMPRPDE